MGSAREGRLPGVALLLVVVVGCTLADLHGVEGASESTTAAEDTTETDAGHDASSSAAGSGTGDGACPDGLPCPDTDPVDLELCEQLDAPICGDAIVQAFEECDGGPGCRACQDASEPAPLIVLEEAYIEAIAPLAEGGVVLLEDHHGPVTRYHADGSVLWSLTTEQTTHDLVVDSTGNAYVVGVGSEDGAYVPWVASWDATGAPRWSMLGAWFGSYEHAAIDATRLVAAGTTEQQNSPLPRGSIGHYDHDGEQQWSEKLSSIEGVFDIALVGDEIAVLGKGLDWRRYLLRVDELGAVRWSIDVSSSDGGGYGAWGVVHDGAGGTWIYGQRDEGPWARQHDADGVVLGDLDCLGATAGSLSQLVVEPRGSLVAAILLSDDVLPIGRVTPWLAWVEGGTVTAGARLGNGETTLRTFGLAQWPDGALAVGVQETNPYVSRVMVVEP